MDLFLFLISTYPQFSKLFLPFPQYLEAPPHAEAREIVSISLLYSPLELISRQHGHLRLFYPDFACRHAFCFYPDMILVIVHMKVSAEKCKELSQTITSLLNCIRTEVGCARCDFFYGLEDENILCLLEEWDSQKNFEIHCNSDCFKVLRGAMNLLEDPCEIISYRYKPGDKGVGQSLSCMKKELNE